MEQSVYLTLQDGQVFAGKSFGAVADVTGELVFTTGMVGYLETLTDPSYYGQIVLQTFPLIGNYGVIPADFESKFPHLKAYIVKDWCQDPSNFRCEGNLDAFLKANNIPGLYGVDTRAITRIVREHGVMNARISSKPLTREEIAALANYRITGSVPAMSRSHREDLPAIPPSSACRRVVIWDFGSTGDMITELRKRGCDLIVMPWNTTADQIKELNPDGILLTNGAGDPAENQSVIREIKAVCRARIPTMGICLGHQLLALSQGGKTEKMKYGHHGANQPVRQVGTSRVYITNQNHNYAVASSALPTNAEEYFVNGNDGTNEGLLYTDMPAFSVQFHPEACGGPQDTTFLFDRFVELMDSHRN